MFDIATPKRRPILGCIADDVTGATDLAINLVGGGMRVTQFLGIPSAEAIENQTNADAIVVALKTRSVDTGDAIKQSLDALSMLKQQGVSRFYFKYCSTFDSTVDGNIGPVAVALMNELNADRTIFCPAFPRAGRTVFQGHLFVGEQLLSESGMQHHPLNPMTDSNLVRFLGTQTERNVGLLPFGVIQSGVEQAKEHAEQLVAENTPLIVTDTCEDSQLAKLASAFSNDVLVTGGSGLGRFLPDAYRSLGLLPASPFEPRLPTATGRSLILAGSCSTATNDQVRWMSGKATIIRLDVNQVVEQASVEAERIKQISSSADATKPLLIASTATADVVADLQKRFGAHQVAKSIEDFFGSIAIDLVGQLSINRLVIAGGETSGAVTGALGIDSLEIGPEICTGVPWTQTKIKGRDMAVTLKSGNFGGDDFFESAIQMLDPE